MCISQAVKLVLCTFFFIKKDKVKKWDILSCIFVYCQPGMLLMIQIMEIYWLSGLFCCAGDSPCQQAINFGWKNSHCSCICWKKGMLLHSTPPVDFPFVQADIMWHLYHLNIIVWGFWSCTAMQGDNKSNWIWHE